MKWLTLNTIKAQLRIDSSFTLEDDLLTLYGDSAEDTVLNTIGRSYTEVVETYGEVPVALKHASLLLVDLSYQQRSPVSMQNMYVVPYTFDIMLKPYVRLANSNEQINNTRYGKCKNL